MFRTLRLAITVLALGGGIASLISSPAHAQPDHAAMKLEDTPKLTVRGEAELQKPADLMRISIGVVSEDKEAGVALRENSTLMRDVVKAIEKSGLEKDEYETGRFQIRPLFSRRPRQPSPDWEPQIIGYQVTNNVIVETKRLDLAGELIENANAAGANSVEVVGFDLANKRQYRAESIRVATAHALDDAKALAGAAGLRLVRIISINLDHTPIQRPGMSFSNRGRAMTEASAAPPIDPGNITVRAGVTIVYEIAPSE